MGNAVTISGSTYTVRGTTRDKSDGKPVVGLVVEVYDKDLIGRDDYLGIGTTDPSGAFEVRFEASAFGYSIFDKAPSLYFLVYDGGTLLLSTKSNPIRNANPSTPDIVLDVDMTNDKLRQLINHNVAPGWVGSFAQSVKEFAYPNPDLSSLPLLDNMDNITLLDRQQKVVWPEFSWLTDPDAKEPTRCYQMFAPDISRLGYTKEGRVYSIICPQQGFYSQSLGSLNVEVTVTGNRGWADEATHVHPFALDMTVMGQIWFGPSAHDGAILKKLAKIVEKNGHTFPFTKKQAIKVETFMPGNPQQAWFPLRAGQSPDFPIPQFAQHADLAWNVGYLGVEIGHIKKTGVAVVDDFNQLIMDVFNLVSGNLLRPGNTLSWNVWFTAPEIVDCEEWQHHAEKWRHSIDTDHGSPDGNGSSPRFFDGSPFRTGKNILLEEGALLAKFFAKHGL